MESRFQSVLRKPHLEMTGAPKPSRMFPTPATNSFAGAKCGFPLADSETFNSGPVTGSAMNPKLYATLLWFAFWGAITVGIWSLTK